MKLKHDFRYISKNSPAVKKDYNNLLLLLNELQDILRNTFTFQYYIVGSYKHNMITYDTKSNIGYDFDFNLEVFADDNYSAKKIKMKFIEGLKKIVVKYGYDFPEDSTRVITIKKKDTKNSKILSSCDFCIVNNYIDEDGYDCQEFIKFDKKTHQYIWNEQSDGYYMLPDKIDWLKDTDNDLWSKVRDRYIYLKNINDDPDVHSRALFAQAVNQICQKYGYFEE